MGKRGIGAKPKLELVGTNQAAFGFAQGEVSALRGTLPWEVEGLNRVERVVAFLEDLPITQGSLAEQNWSYVLGSVTSSNRFTAKMMPDAAPSAPLCFRWRARMAKLSLSLVWAFVTFWGESESRGEVYAAANDKAQSGKTFAEMVAILDDHKELDARCNVVKFSKRIEVLSGAGKGSIFAALSADASTKQGLSPSFTIYDELGTAPKRDLYEALDTAMGARDNPLLCVISTQAASDTAVLSELIDYGKKVNSGEVIDPSFHLTFYGADMDDDPWCEATWLKANPALGDFRSLDDVQRQASQARRMPAAEQGFRNLILNQRVDAHVRFLAKAEWDANGGAVDYDKLVGRKCYGGLDLSQSRDLTAFVLAFPDDLGGIDIVPRFFLPENGIREKSELDRVPYDVWAKQGFLTLIPGSVVDPSFVAEAIAEACETYDVQRLAYDRWRVADLKRELDRMGAETPLEPFGQGFRDMAPALDKMERLVAEANLRHAGNPLLTFCASNAVVEMDPAGNRKLAKNKSSGRIDGMVALAMALAVIDRETENAMPACLAELMG